MSELSDLRNEIRGDLKGIHERLDAFLENCGACTVKVAVLGEKVENLEKRKVILPQGVPLKLAMALVGVISAALVGLFAVWKIYAGGN